jgi:hypothetical protein
MSTSTHIGAGKMAQGNYVAKNLHKTSRAATHADRKKNAKRGYQKHNKGHAKEAWPACF